MSPILGIIASSYQSAVVGAFESIQTISPTTNPGNITFSSIPGTYKHLQIRCNSRMNQFTEPGFRIRFNSDSGANYSVHRLGANGSITYAQAGASQTNIGFYGPAGGDMLANVYGTNIVDILDYTSTTKFKTVRGYSSVNDSGLVSGGTVQFQSGNWRNSANAITSIYIEFDGLVVTNSTFSLYGIK